MTLYRIASILAFLVGIMSIVAGGKAMKAGTPAIPSFHGFPSTTS